MSDTLSISIGQASDPGGKPANQDFHGALFPGEPLRTSKGIALAVADGIGSSTVSGEAAQAAIKSFLSDYYCTSDSWSVKTSVHRVLAATNSWLHAQNQRSDFRYDRDRGYVCTFSGMVVKSATAYLFHVGDSRIYRLTGGTLEQLTRDHRTYVSAEQSYLSRALGANQHLEIDHLAVRLEPGDVFVLATDGLHDVLDAATIKDALHRHADLDRAARLLVDQAIARGSDDNLTIQIVRIDSVPTGDATEMLGRFEDLPLPPPLLEPPAELDGMRLLRTLHRNNRSHIHLAQDLETGAMVVVKLPSVDLRDDPEYLKRLMMEEWVARRLASPHVLGSPRRQHPQSCQYVVLDYVEGQSLAQWMRDNPKPHLEIVRQIVRQIALGLRAFHKKEMLHQDLRPENIMIDRTGTVKLIDFGSVRVAGVNEASAAIGDEAILGSLQYTAPEYFLGSPPGPWSDVFSLAVLTYQMLSGRLPYGIKVQRIRKRSDLGRLRYPPLFLDNPGIPAWVDAAIEKALSPDPAARYGDADEFIHDLHSPGENGAIVRRPSLMDRNPLLFWKAISALLLATSLLQLAFSRFH